ncbi:hypothetical protein TRFO_01985 [Tritrichomonas foetus]|uniref:Nucleotide-diphospho-sugar transferase domain-containing protein n=1 Tax=Tritrichomonas foetus TaxID=1144522 RepID=A0A1J4JI75_9EUKA|nr:hypothetical protein TRFO_01985 [Tritrichomonas foetus]|eukprot:OHS96892.1 hypothetical protein TRFO_01985 [Tritrichomonas foetus]
MPHRFKDNHYPRAITFFFRSKGLMALIYTLLFFYCMVVICRNKNWISLSIHYFKPILAWKLFPNLQTDNYSLPSEFLTELRNVVNHLKSYETHQIMLTIFNRKYFQLASNLYCSTTFIPDFPLQFHYFVATDELSYNRFLNFTNQVLFLDVSDKIRRLEHFDKIKLIIQYQLLIWNFESILLDADTLLFQNPQKLFDNNADIEVSADTCCDYVFDNRFNYQDFNIGFLKATPNEVTKKVYHDWIQTSFKNKSNNDQKVLQDLIFPYRKQMKGSNQSYSYPGLKRNLEIHFFHPLDFPNAGMLFLHNRFETERQARRLGFTKPFGIHLAWIKYKHKENILTANNFWFFNTTTFKCLMKRPRGAYFSNWNSNTTYV